MMIKIYDGEASGIYANPLDVVTITEKDGKTIVRMKDGHLITVEKPVAEEISKAVNDHIDRITIRPKPLQTERSWNPYQNDFPPKAIC